MEVVPTTAALVAGFVLPHLVLTAGPVRAALRRRLGSVRLASLVSVIAWVTFVPLAWFYAAHRHEGPPGLGLGGVPVVAWPSIVAMSLGMVLMVAIVAPSAYPASAAAVFARHSHEPRGLERITRHPFFFGLAIFGTAHALMATHLVGTIVFGGLAAMALIGAASQDRRLLAARGEEHRRYLASTSFVPLVAVLRGRQRIAWGELPWASLSAGIAAALGARWVHGTGFAHGWLVVAIVMVVVPVWLAAASAFRHHRARSHGPAASPHRRDPPPPP